MNSYKNLIVLLFLVLLSGSSCKSLFRKDRSLTVKEYQAMGMPSVDTVWTEEKLLKAHNTIAYQRSKNFFALPKKESRRSSAVFNRIISRENLFFLDDTTLSLRDKAYDIQSFSSFLHELGRMYTDVFRSRQYYSAELIDIYTFELYVRKKMFELADKIDRSDKPDDIRMQQGRIAIVAGYVHLVGSLMGEQVRTRSYSRGELEKLRNEVVQSITENIHYLDNGSKQKIAADIKNLLEKHPAGYIGRKYNKALKTLSTN